MLNDKQCGAYLLFEIFTVFVILVGPLVFFRFDTCRRHVYSVFPAILDAKLEVQQASADVVFVGDSSLLTGVEPRLIKEQTGLSSYNLGLSAGVFCWAGDAVLNAYLANNQTPKLIVLYLSPQTNCSSIRSTKPNDGAYEEIMTFLTLRQTRRLLFRLFSHLDYLPAFDQETWRLALTNFDLGEQRYLADRALLSANRGYYKPSVQEAMNGCPEVDPGHPLDTNFLHQFQQHYRSPLTEVGIYLGPMPDCDPRYARCKREAAGIADNVPERLPRTMFVDDVNMSHLLPVGAAQNSKVVSTFLMHTLNLSGKVADGIASSGTARN